MEERLSNDSSRQVKGFVYQFLIALEKCFAMREGQSVYIECHGDVSVEGAGEGIQYEAKWYKRALTDLDINVWKSIANWIHPNFPIEQYDALVLLTTQKIGNKSKWERWNGKPYDERKRVIEWIRRDFNAKPRKSRELKAFMDVIFSPDNADRLEKIIRKLALDTEEPDASGYYDRLCDQHAQHLARAVRMQYINSLYGYIINPHIIEKKWEISQAAYTRECQHLSQKLQENSVVFPAKVRLQDINVDSYRESNFVTKIHDIQYDEEIPQAVEDYVYAGTVIQEDFNQSPAIVESYKNYESERERIYRVKYRSACRNNEADSRIKASQNLYDELTTGESSSTIHTYRSIPLAFQSGVMQILAEEKEDIVWLVKPEGDE